MPINHEIPREERKKKRETCLSEQQFPPPLVKFTSNPSMTTSMTAENLDKEKDRFRRLAESSVSLTTPFQIAKEGKEVSSEWSNLRQCNEILRETSISLDNRSFCVSPRRSDWLCTIPAFIIGRLIYAKGEEVRGDIARSNRLSVPARYSASFSPGRGLPRRLMAGGRGWDPRMTVSEKRGKREWRLRYRDAPLTRAGTDYRFAAPL